MKRVAFYHKDTGLLAHVVLVASDDKVVEANTPADHAALELKDGLTADPLSQMVDVATGKMVDYQPPQPSADHEWDAAVKRWQLKPEVATARAGHRLALRTISQLEAAQARAIREHVLGDQSALARVQSIEQQIVAQRAKLINDYISFPMEAT